MTIEELRTPAAALGARVPGMRNYCPPGALSLCQLVFYQSADLYFQAVPDSFSATEALI